MVLLTHPADPAYDQRRTGFQTHRRHRPSVVVSATSADEVVAGVRLARDEGRQVAVQATGHGVGAVEGEPVLIDTSGMRGVRVDAEERTATIGAGTRWGEVVTAAAEHGLAPLNGSAPGVGVVGYLLAGGIPLLGRSRGWAAAGVRSLEVVTADAEKRIVGGEDSDLGWALRGGGGSFAVVSAVTVNLIELETIYAGSLMLPAERPEQLRDALIAWRDWAAELPGATSTSVAAVAFPDIDGPPPTLRGRTVLAVRIAHDGSPEDGESVAAPMRALAQPLLDDVRERPWTGSGAIHNDPTDPAGSLTTNLALGELSDDAIAATVETFAADTEPGAVRRVIELRRLGGALGEPAGLPVRYDAAWTAGTISVFTPHTTRDGVERGATRDHAYRDALAEHSVGRVANFLAGADAEDPATVRTAYRPQDWQRLCAIKAELDADDLIRGAAPIPVGGPEGH